MLISLRNFQKAEIKIDLDVDFNEYCFDSLDYVEMATDLEHRLLIDITDEEMANVKDGHELVKLCNSKPENKDKE